MNPPPPGPSQADSAQPEEVLERDPRVSNAIGALTPECTVLTVEDDLIARKFLRITLQKAGCRVLEADSGEEALELSDRHAPQVALLDLGLPGMDGLDVCRSLRERHEDMAILILTGRSEDSDKVAGLNLGADDYLVKPLAPDVLVARINAVLRRCRRQHQTQDVLTLGDLRLEFRAMKVYKGDRAIELTRREFALLAAFLKHPGEVLSRDQLRDEVWGENHHGSAKGLDVLVCKLREKLENDPANPRYFRTAWGVGFVCG